MAQRETQVRRSSVGTSTLERRADQPGYGLGHYCAAHATDIECKTYPQDCRAYCGYRFGAVPNFDKDWSCPGCVVCDEMEAARYG